MLYQFHKVKIGSDYRITFLLSLFKDDFPWMYDMGRVLQDTLKSDESREQKEDTIKKFLDVIIYFSSMLQTYYNDDRIIIDYWLFRDLPKILFGLFIDILDESKDEDVAEK